MCRNSARRASASVPRARQPLVLLLGVDDGDLDAPVQAAEDLQLGVVGLARPALGEDDRVVVRLGEAVPQHQPLAGGVAAVQDPVGAWQLGGGEREGGGQRPGVQRAPQPQRVDAQRQGRGPAVQAAEGRRVAVEELRAEQGSDRLGLLLQRGQVVGPDRQVQTGPEQPALAAGELAGQVRGVVGGGFGLEVDQAALVGVQAAGGFEPGELAAQPLGGDRCGDRLDVDGDVEGAGGVEHRVEPAKPDLVGIAGHRQGAAPGLADSEPPRADLQRIRPEQPASGLLVRRAGAAEECWQCQHPRLLVMVSSGDASPAGWGGASRSLARARTSVAAA